MRETRAGSATTRLIACVAWLCLSAGCADPSGGGQPGDAGPQDFSHGGCGAAPSGELLTIADVVEHINGLPRPVTLDCFVASLPRPLAVAATRSKLSVQPATGPENPRIFLFTAGLVMALLPEGPGSELLELGEWTRELRTLKAEIPFPVTAALTADAPFAQVRDTQGSSKCAACHRDETLHADIDGAYESVAFRIQPGTEVPLSELREVAASCTPQAAEACLLLRALFEGGEAEPGGFPEGTALFFREG